MKSSLRLNWELDTQNIFINDVIQWAGNLCVVRQTYHRYGFRFISVHHIDKEGCKVTTHYIEQSHVKLVGRNYKGRIHESKRTD